MLTASSHADCPVFVLSPIPRMYSSDAIIVRNAFLLSSSIKPIAKNSLAAVFYYLRARIPTAEKCPTFEAGTANLRRYRTYRWFPRSSLDLHFNVEAHHQVVTGVAFRSSSAPDRYPQFILPIATSRFAVNDSNEASLSPLHIRAPSDLILDAH